MTSIPEVRRKNGQQSESWWLVLAIEQPGPSRSPDRRIHVVEEAFALQEASRKGKLVGGGSWPPLHGGLRGSRLSTFLPAEGADTS